MGGRQFIARFAHWKNYKEAETRKKRLLSYLNTSLVDKSKKFNRNNTF